MAHVANGISNDPASMSVCMATGSVKLRVMIRKINTGIPKLLSILYNRTHVMHRTLSSR